MPLLLGERFSGKVTFTLRLRITEELPCRKAGEWEARKTGSSIYLHNVYLTHADQRSVATTASGTNRARGPVFCKGRFLRMKTGPVCPCVVHGYTLATEAELSSWRPRSGSPKSKIFPIWPFPKRACQPPGLNHKTHEGKDSIFGLVPCCSFLPGSV